ncbi:MAG: hypothetical protein HYR51_00060 [Candidatus Rokubacteria bacterium]|nr:hypothetical protein [Candidatus Rokubacteria bacterium]
MVRLTGTERAVAEVAAIAEHVASLTAATAAFQLRPDIPEDSGGAGTGLVPLLDEGNAAEAAAPLTEIRTWVRRALDVDHVPAVWRALAHQPRLLESTWRKDRLVLGAGALDELVKGCAALAVAQFRQSAYWIAYFTRLLRTRSGLTDRGVVELAGAVMHYVSFNTIAHGMRLDAPFSDMTAADVAPGGRFERHVPGARLPVSEDAANRGSASRS